MTGIIAQDEILSIIKSRHEDEKRERDRRERGRQAVVDDVLAAMPVFLEAAKASGVAEFTPIDASDWSDPLSRKLFPTYLPIAGIATGWDHVVRPRTVLMLTLPRLRLRGGDVCCLVKGVVYGGCKIEDVSGVVRDLVLVEQSGVAACFKKLATEFGNLGVYED